MDLRTYLALLPPPEAAWLDAQLAGRLASLAAAAEDEAAASAATDGRASAEARDVLRRRVCALQMQEELRGACADSNGGGDSRAADVGAPAAGGAGSAAAAAAAAEAGESREARRHALRALELVELFSDALPLSRGLDERERGPADELLALCAAALVRAAAADGAARGPARGGGAPAAGPLLRAAAVLEAGVCGRPYGAEGRLGLAALYGLFGCPQAAAAHFLKTEAKHIQMDTLASHHLLPAALAVGADKVTSGVAGGGSCGGGRAGDWRIGRCPHRPVAPFPRP